MRPAAIRMAIVLLLAVPAGAHAGPAPDPAAERHGPLKIDPLLLAAAAEVWKVVATSDNPVWPGWDASDTPILFYFPGVQDVLINHPSPPEGFVPYEGPLPFPGGAILQRDGPTLIDWDGQNTSREINGVPTLVVADTLSNRRQWLRGLLDDARPAEDKISDVAYGDLVSDPYGKMAMIAHEAFHVFQDRSAPDKGANEANVRLYPCLSVENNVGFALEGDALADVLRARDRDGARAAAVRWLAVRLDRRAGLSPEAIEYEDGNEFGEGLAMFVEWKLAQVLEGRRPDDVLWWGQGFHGFDDLSEMRDRLVDGLVQNMRGEANVNNDPYGTSPLRGRLYFSGMAIAALLDRLAPAWKGEILAVDTTLTTLAADTIAAAPEELARALAAARSGPAYAELFEAKRKLEAAGRRDTQERLEQIVSGPRTSLIVDYSALGEPRVGLSFTPFGVRAVDAERTIYTLVPIGASIGSEGYRFKQEVPLPTLENRAERYFQFQLADVVGAEELTARLKSRGEDDWIVDDLDVRLPGVQLQADRARIEHRGDTIRVSFLPES